MVSSDATGCNGFDANKPCPNTGVLDWSDSTVETGCNGLDANKPHPNTGVLDWSVSTVEAGCAGFDENPPNPPNNGLDVWLDPDENKLPSNAPGFDVSSGVHVFVVNTNDELVDSSFDVAGVVEDAPRLNIDVILLFGVVDAVLGLLPQTGAVDEVLTAKEFVPNAF